MPTTQATAKEMMAQFGYFGFLEFCHLREINIQEARSIAISALRYSLAYGYVVMKLAEAEQAVDQFLPLITGSDVKYYTNVGEILISWSVATGATMERGIVVMSNSLCGVLWVDEDD